MGLGYHHQKNGTVGSNDTNVGSRDGENVHVARGVVGYCGALTIIVFGTDSERLKRKEGPPRRRRSANNGVDGHVEPGLVHSLKRKLPTRGMSGGTRRAMSGDTHRGSHAGGGGGMC